MYDGKADRAFRRSHKSVACLSRDTELPLGDAYSDFLHEFVRTSEA